MGREQLRCRILRTPKSRDRPLAVTFGEQSVAQVVVGVGEIGPQPHGLPILGNGLGVTTLGGQGVTQTEMSLRRARLKAQNLLELPGRFLVPPELIEAFPQVVVEDRYPGPRSHGPCHQPGPLGEPAGLRLDQTQQMQSIGVPGVPAQHLFQTLTGTRCVPRTLQGEALFQSMFGCLSCFETQRRSASGSWLLSAHGYSESSRSWGRL